MIYEFKPFERPEILHDHLNLGGNDGKGGSIGVNSLFLERDGKPWLPVMGEYHFSRDQKDNWPAELAKMYAGGVRIVATYLFWIHHEETEGQLSFEGNLDIRKFVEDARSAGLEVVLRVGPWAHGECRNGGFPDWILKKPYKVRNNNPEYLSEVRRWFKAIADEVKGLFYKDGGNIVAVQLENELTGDAEHLAKLKEIAIETGLIAPLYTVTGWNSKFGARIPVDEVLPVFGAYPDAPWAGGTARLPLSRHFAFYTMRNDTAIGADIISGDSDGWMLPYERYPYATCEIGPGMESTHHRRVVVSPMDAYSMSLVKLGAGNNLVGYYMFHGGTNPVGKLTTFNESKDSGYPNDCPILNYDFGTCLSQYGEVRGQYRYLNLLHLFINDFGDILAPMVSTAAASFADENDKDGLRYCMRTDGKAGFIFVNNHQRLMGLNDKEKVSFRALGTVTPEIDVKGDVAFILPVNIELEGEVLEYATAQLLCRDGNTFFFASIPGVAPLFKFKGSDEFEAVTGLYTKQVGNIRIVVLEPEDALYLRKIDDRVYIGDRADIYSLNGEIKCAEPGDYEYREYCGDSFFSHVKEVDYNPPRWDFKLCEPAFTLDEKYAKELNMEADTPRKRNWEEITVSSPDGFIEIDKEYDTAQIYADGKLVADKFYEGRVWKVPAALVYGKKSFLITSELRDDCNFDFKNYI